MREDPPRGGKVCKSLPWLLAQLDELRDLELEHPDRITWQKRADGYRRRYNVARGLPFD